jgi:hypothetical protein
VIFPYWSVGILVGKLAKMQLQEGRTSSMISKEFPVFLIENSMLSLSPLIMEWYCRWGAFIVRVVNCLCGSVNNSQDKKSIKLAPSANILTNLRKFKSFK